MEPTATTVHRILEQDGVLREAIRRDIVNQRALARWMIRRHHWKTSEDAVVGKIRTALLELDSQPLRAAEGVLAKTHINMRSRVSIVKLSKTADVQKLLPRLFNLVDYTKGEALRIIQSERSIKIFVDESKLEAVLRLTKDSDVESKRRGVTEINVVMGPDSESVPGLAALLMGALAYQGINIVEVLTGIPEVLVFVDDRDALRAYEALAALIESCTGVKA